MAAVIDANRGKTPATGEELVAALRKVGEFHQLPIPFSAVRLTSGLVSPRVVLAPHVTGPSRADATARNIDGRLYLAANMERTPGYDPRVESVEFISWNPTRRQFDFGVIEHVGDGGEPLIRVVDGGKCFSCHKNRGPILGARPWSNTTHDDILRFSVAVSLKVDGTNLPRTGPFAVPRSVNGVLQRERIDGMALAMPEAQLVDDAVRRGAAIRTNRDVIRLMTRTPDGRKGLVILLVAVTVPGALDATKWDTKWALDATFDPSFYRFGQDWVELQKSANSGMLLDVDPAKLLVASGVRKYYKSLDTPTPTSTVSVPGLVGGSGSRWAAVPSPAARAAAQAQKAVTDYNNTLIELGRYEAARAAGSHGLTSNFQPSNPKAFAPRPVTAPRRASDVFNPVMVADTIGLTDGDRRFLTRSLADAATRVSQPKVTAPSLAQQVFEGPHFADVLAGGPIPDRDEFKDRFVAGLDDVLKTTHRQPVGFAPDRREYASGPRYDPAAAEEREVAVVPTTACLRCHEVSTPGKAPRFDPIPPLAFDPFDRPGREAWLKGADVKRKREVLGRLVQRLATDADMPPADAPEHDRFRVRDAAGFDEVKRFLAAELDSVRER
jgi:hypothetical protein